MKYSINHTNQTISRHPGFRPLLAAEVVVATGMELTAVTIPWLVLTMTGSAAATGWVMAAQIAPVALLGAAGGSWAARFGPHRWMIGSDLSRGLLITAVPTLYLLGLLNLPVLLVVVFAIGAFTAPYLASQQTIVAELLGEDEVLLTKATSLLQGAVRTALLLGPPFAAVLIMWLGIPAVLFLNGATYLVTAVIVWRLIPTPYCVGLPVARARVRDGWRILRRDGLLLSWTFGTVFTEAAWRALFVLIPVLAMTRYGGNVGVVGMALGAFGAGALIGSLSATWVVRRYSPIMLTTGGKVAQGLIFGFLLLDLSPPGLAACLLAAGLFNGLSNGPAAAVRLTRIPPELRPHTLSLFSAITLVGGTLGLVFGGFAFSAVGAQATIAGMFALQICGSSLFLLGSRLNTGEKQSAYP